MPVQILTPDGVAFETDDAALLSAPGAAGDLQVEPGHANLMTTLRVGRLRVLPAGGEAEQVLAVHGGMLEATPQRVLVLADAAEKAEGIDRARAEAARRRAERRLRSRAEEIDVARAEASLARALLRLNVLSGPAPG